MAVLWHPDTCECQFEVTDDWSSAKTISACAHHAGAKDPWITVRNENAYKNIVIGFIHDSHPDLEVSCTYSLGPLTVFTGLSAADKAVLQSKLDAHFGKGEVTVGG